VRHVIQADRKLTVVAKPSVRAAILVWMLPRVAHHLCIGKRCSIFDETGSLGPNLKIIVSNSPKAATILNKHNLGEKKEGAATKSDSRWSDIASQNLREAIRKASVFSVDQMGGTSVPLPCRQIPHSSTGGDVPLAVARC
jgi:hypothetical protein